MEESISIQNHLHAVRGARGIAAAQLARLAGVSRQTIYAIEAGDYIPNTSLALLLARVLEVPVEELFSLEGDPPPLPKPVPVELLGAPALPGQPVQICQVGRKLLGVAAEPQAMALPLADGVIASDYGAPGSAPVQLFDDPVVHEKRLLVAGCDPGISLLAQQLVREGVELVHASCSSAQALEWLKEGKVHVAGSHLKDTHTGEYNVAAVKALFPRGGMQVVTFAIWEQGLVVARGNPKSIRSAADLARPNISIVNRESGAGSRQLLDEQLAAQGVNSSVVHGYRRIAHGHLPAAMAVAHGEADCCLATRAAARAFGLDFLPLATERYDLVFHRKAAELPAVQSLLQSLNRSALRRRLEVLAGYDTSRTGREVGTA